jgi:hypothetical protein
MVLKFADDSAIVGATASDRRNSQLRTLVDSFLHPFPE